jgi:hypothetical protein
MAEVNMSRPRSTKSLVLKVLALAVAVAALACLAAVALAGWGLLPRNTARTWSIAVGSVGLLLLGARVLQSTWRRAGRDQLSPASELSTLTFPPMSRLDRPRVQRLK